MLLAYAANELSRRVLWFTPVEQALHVLPLLFMSQVVMVLVRLMAGAEFPAGGCSSAPSWPRCCGSRCTPVLLLPQYQPVSRDENRPIFSSPHDRHPHARAGARPFPRRLAVAGVLRAVFSGCSWRASSTCRWSQHDYYSTRAEDNRIAIWCRSCPTAG